MYQVVDVYYTVLVLTQTMKGRLDKLVDRHLELHYDITGFKSEVYHISRLAATLDGPT